MNLLKKPLTRAVLPALALGTLLTQSSFAQSRPNGDDGFRPPRPEPKNLVEKLSDIRRFSTLSAAIDAAGLSDALSEIDAATVFAPSNRAFRQLPEGTVEALLENPEALADLLLYHVVPGTLRANDLENGELQTLLEGETVDISVSRYWEHYQSIQVDDSNIRRRDITASNGIIHEIDAVLDPTAEPVPTLGELVAAPQFSTLRSLLEQAHLTYLLELDYREFTLFAPDNAAFEKIPAADLEALGSNGRALRRVLLNHLSLGTLTNDDLLGTDSVRTLARRSLPVLSTDSVPPVITIGGATVTEADALATNGVLHTIDSVLLIERPVSLPELIAANENLNTLEAALGASGLDEALGTRRSFTVFAPSDAAFAALPDGVLDSLLEDPTGALADVLQLHVVRGKLTSNRLRDGQKIPTLSGDRLAVAVGEDGAITINGVPVSTPDLRARNGVVHIIDGVLETQPFTLADLVASRSYLSTLGTALEASGLDAAIADPDAELTLLAPLNKAFRDLPEGTLEALLEDPEGALADILRLHVIPGSFSVEELLEAGTVTSLGGEELVFETRTFEWFWFRFRRVAVNGIHLIVTDLPADNGTLHVITEVILPAAEGDSPEPRG